MQSLQTAIIRHTTTGNTHHDWLIEDAALPNPQDPRTRLWTARITPPPSDWLRLGRLELTVLPPHRRAYLNYQGPVSGGRGDVMRVARGTCIPQLWTNSRIIVDLQTHEQAMHIEMRQHAGDRWFAVVL